MQISDLINILQQALEANGDLPVRLQTDHGQSLMALNGYGVSYIEDSSWMPEVVDEDSLEDYPEAIKVYELQAF